MIALDTHPLLWLDQDSDRLAAEARRRAPMNRLIGWQRSSTGERKPHTVRWETAHNAIRLPCVGDRGATRAGRTILAPSFVAHQKEKSCSVM